MNVFVEKAPMTIDRGQHCYVEDGECMPVARFTSSDLMKGTRVYNDGKLVGYVKRRLLADSTLAGKTASGETTFSASTKYRQRRSGSRPQTRKRFESAPGTTSSRRRRRRSGRRTTRSSASISSRTVTEKVRGTIPGDLQKGQPGAADRDVQVTAIQVFNHKEPRAVPVVAIDDVFDPGPNVAALEAALAQAGPGARDSE